jgi:hypothetical protein
MRRKRSKRMTKHAAKHSIKLVTDSAARLAPESAPGATRDSSDLYSSTLEQLNRILVTMLSPEWDAALQEVSPTERQAALRELLRVQHARLVLGNAILQEIAEDLKENEASIVAGQEAVQSALDRLESVSKVLTAVGGLIDVVARIVTFL